MGSFYSTTAGDTAPKLRATLRNEAGDVQDLTGVAADGVKLRIHGGPELTATIIDAANGVVETALPADLRVGIHQFHHRVTFPAAAGDTSFPKGDYDVLEVAARPTVPA